MALERINLLPEEESPVASDVVPIDGATTRQTTIQRMVDAGAPIASQAEAEAGVNASKRMTPLTTAQAIDARLDNAIASKVGVSVASQDFQLSTPAQIRPLPEKVGDVASALDYIPRSEHAAIKAGTSTFDATTYLNAILTDYRQVVLPSGKVNIDTLGLTIPDETSLEGSGDGQTKIQTLSVPVNMVRLKNWSQVKNLRLKGIYDFVSGGAGVLYQGSYSRSENVTVEDIGTQGFAYQGGNSNRNFQVNTRAIHCGHRGLNMSEGSWGNIVEGFTAEDCRLAGLLVGYRSHDNLFSKILLRGINENSLWVHMDCWRNMFDQVNIADPADVSKALLYIGPHVSDSIFTNFILSGIGANGYGVRLNNFDVDNTGLGTTNGHIEGNTFRGFKIFGTGASTNDGIKHTVANSREIKNNAFEDFYIDGLQDGVDSDAAGISGNEYRKFRFGAVTRQFRGGLNATQYRASRCEDFDGVTGIGSLALVTSNLEAQPTFPGLGTVLTNPYPFPVTVELTGVSTGGGVEVNGTNLKSGTAAGGDYSVRLPRGATIRVTGTGTPAWRWWAI